jgi:CTP synthase (UTP-ammonia lyase)
MKIDPYLNVDAGTMNSVARGEVFVVNFAGFTVFNKLSSNQTHQR